ncbi:E3 ubiquitin-protein ligase znrf3 [Channa argus]|uniref:E3 ubiquitin-protein ligase znrf3 n=1 Tax=Channa argus TaxID=215402 RepID=A0A6G1PYW4_CHAAH|nr:E3 ubiquitin-protein ligase znrf3 [Channa argus]
MMILPRRSADRVPDAVVLVILVVAASLGTVFAKDTAFVEVVLFESSPNGDYTTYTTGLQGRFSKAGATISAEGEIVQAKRKELIGKAQVENTSTLFYTFPHTSSRSDLK